MKNFYTQSILILMMVFSASAKAEKRTIPFKMLFNHDGTYLTTCVSPWANQGLSIGEELKMSVREAADAGCDAVAFSPGNGEIPWWQSKFYPDHWTWSAQYTGHKKPDRFGQYVLDGGDMVRDFVDVCREKKINAIISIRLKDEHGVGEKSQWVSRFWSENQHLRVDPRPGAVFGYRGLDWMYPKVTEQKLKYIREFCENYDIDGIELDFMRFFPFFNEELTTDAQRRQIINGFVCAVRGILDRTSPPGHRRYLGVRVPNRISMDKRFGFDLGYWDRQGWTDYAVISPSYCSQVENELPQLRDWIPDTSLLFEMTHCVTRSVDRSWGRPGLGSDANYEVRFTTLQKLITMANLAWQRGADGLSLFNFVYYRPGHRGQISGGKYNPGEPPWKSIPKLLDRDWLVKQPQNYWVNWWWSSGYFPDQFVLPKVFVNQTECVFKLDVALPHVPVTGGVLRLEMTEITPELGWRVYLNDVLLPPSGQIGEPFKDSYGGFLGDPHQYCAFKIIPTALKNGENEIRIRLADGPISPEFSANLMYIDVALFTEDRRESKQDPTQNVSPIKNKNLGDKQ